MEGTLLVSPQELKNTANTFSNRGKTISTITTEMMNLVKNLTSIYEGDASTAYIKNFGNLQEDMNQINRKIQEHVTDLNDMADNYTRVEDGNTQANAALKSDYI